MRVNKAVNDNLQQQAKSLYEEMFLNNPDADMVSGTLSDIATITMGQSPSGSSYNEESVGEIFYQGRAEFGFRFPTRRLFTTEPKRMAEPGDVLLSVRAPVGDLNVAYEKCCIGRGLGAIHSKTGDSSFMLYTMFALKPQLDVFNGEGTVFGSINRNGLSNLPVNIPSAEEIAKFEATVRPMDIFITAPHSTVYSDPHFIIHRKLHKRNSSVRKFKINFKFLDCCTIIKSLRNAQAKIVRDASSFRAGIMRKCKNREQGRSHIHLCLRKKKCHRHTGSRFSRSPLHRRNRMRKLP